jgi:hypothetical protein
LEVILRPDDELRTGLDRRIQVVACRRDTSEPANFPVEIHITIQYIDRKVI